LLFEVRELSLKIEPVDENILFIVLDAFGLPLYKIEDELFQHYVLTCDHRRVRPMSKEELVSEKLGGTSHGEVS
jgi:hypothetical protein